MSKKLIYVDANGVGYEEEDGEFNLEVLKAIAMDMGIVADKYLTGVETILGKSENKGFVEETDKSFVEVSFISTGILEKGMEEADDLYDYLTFVTSSVKSKERINADRDMVGTEHAIKGLQILLEALEDAFESAEKEYACGLVKTWILSLTRAYGHSLVWQKYYKEKNEYIEKEEKFLHNYIYYGNDMTGNKK